jgi:hypothetical protein
MNRSPPSSPTQGAEGAARRLLYRHRLARRQAAGRTLRSGEGILVADLDMELVTKRKRMMDSWATMRARNCCTW